MYQFPVLGISFNVSRQHFFCRWFSFLVLFLIVLLSFSELRAADFQSKVIVNQLVQEVEPTSATLTSLADETPKDNAVLHILYPDNATPSSCNAQLMGLSDTGSLLLAIEKKCLIREGGDQMTVPLSLELKLPSGYSTGRHSSALHESPLLDFAFSTMQWLSLKGGDLHAQRLSEDKTLLHLPVPKASQSESDIWLLQNPKSLTPFIHFSSEKSTHHMSSLRFCESSTDSHQNHCVVGLNGEGCQCLNDSGQWESAENPRFLLSDKLDEKHWQALADIASLSMSSFGHDKMYCRCADKNILGVTTVESPDICRSPLSNGTSCQTQMIYNYLPVLTTTSTTPSPHFSQVPITTRTTDFYLDPYSYIEDMLYEGVKLTSFALLMVGGFLGINLCIKCIKKYCCPSESDFAKGAKIDF